MTHEHFHELITSIVAVEGLIIVLIVWYDTRRRKRRDENR